MEYIIFFAVVLSVIVLIMLFGIAEELRSEKLFAMRMKTLYGKKPDKKRVVDYISYYADMEKAPDEITVNDLELDLVFDRIDYTASRTGEEILSKILLEPTADRSELDKRNRHITFFSDNEDDRVRLLVLMRKINHNLKVPFFEVVDFIAGKEKKNLYVSIIADIILVLSIVAAVFVNPGFFIPVVILMVYQAIMYYRLKQGLDAYLPTTALVLHLSKIDTMYKKFSKAFYEEFDGELNEMKECCKKLDSLNRFSFLAFNVSDGMDIAGIVLTYINMVFHFDLIKLYSMFMVITGERDTILRLYELVGSIEAWDSVAYFRASLDVWSVPGFSDGKNDMILKGVYHPLIDNAVKNDLSTGGRGVLFTGSNASGKSTFLKAIALNALFAPTIVTVCASEYKAPHFRIYTSMALRDDVVGGKSYFVVEVNSVKRILDAIDGSSPILVVIDEVLRGTNTAERIGAAYAILSDIAEKNALVFTATHDLELTELLKDKYDNKHFDEDGGDDDVSFSYKLKDGPATARNAIRLMGRAGFDTKIIEEAERTAKEFL